MTAAPQGVNCLFFWGCSFERQADMDKDLREVRGMENEWRGREDERGEVKRKGHNMMRGPKSVIGG